MYELLHAGSSKLSEHLPQYRRWHTNCCCEQIHNWQTLDMTPQRRDSQLPVNTIITTSCYLWYKSEHKSYKTFVSKSKVKHFSEDVDEISALIIQSLIMKTAEKNFDLWIEASLHPVRLWRCQHNGWWVWTTGHRVALRLQQLTTPPTGQLLCLVYNSCGLMPSRTSINICTYLHLKPKYFLKERLGGCECGNKISDANFLLMFNNNHGSFVCLA